MANAFKDAANKGKKQAGGVPEELTAGAGQDREVIPAAVAETVAPAPVVPTPVVPALETIPQAVAPVPEAPKEEAKENNLAAIYEAKKREEPEARNVRLQAVITPSLNEKLNAMVAAGKIKSKNDLINFLLERYLFDENK